MTIGDRIRNRRIELGLSIEQVALELNISRATAYRYEGNYIEKLPVSTLEPLARVLKTTPEYLMGWSDNISKHVDFDNITPLSELPKKQVPILGSIACGKPIYAEEQRGEYIETDINADFALTCKGDSMIGARINDGDLVFIRKQNIVDNGSIAAVIINDEATLKRVFYYPEKEKLILQAENSKYEPLIYAGSELEEVKILGKAVAFQSLL